MTRRKPDPQNIAQEPRGRSCAGYLPEDVVQWVIWVWACPPQGDSWPATLGRILDRDPGDPYVVEKAQKYASDFRGLWEWLDTSCRRRLCDIAVARYGKPAGKPAKN